MPSPRRFLQLDVFSDRPGAGNPLAVILDADDLSTEDMQALANWTNLSETVFLLPPTTPEASYRVRIFTPRQELPFAGHPSVGAAHAALDSGLATARDGHLVQECAAGLLPMHVAGPLASRSISVRAPRAQSLDTVPDPATWAAATRGLDLGALPATIIHNGPRWWVLELADEAAVRGMVPDFAAISALTEATGAVGVSV